MVKATVRATVRVRVRARARARVKVCVFDSRLHEFHIKVAIAGVIYIQLS